MGSSKETDNISCTKARHTCVAAGSAIHCIAAVMLGPKTGHTNQQAHLSNKAAAETPANK